MSTRVRLTRREVLRGTVIGLATVAAGTTPSTAAPAASQTPAPVKPLTGQRIAVLHLTGPEWNVNFKTELPNFEAKTGIKAEVDFLPEASQMPKVRTVLGAKSDEYDVFFFRGNFMPEVIKGGGVEPLDAYIAKSKVEDKEFNYDDIIPAVASAFNFDGKQWGLPLNGGGTILFYNKEMFEAAGLQRPPKNLDELEEYARKLTKPGRAGFVLRGRREAGTNVYAWIFIWKMAGAKWYDNIRGEWFDEQWQPQFASKEAIEATERWARMLREYGPKGVGSYGWNEALIDFQQGTVAMWMDNAMYATQIEDPRQSKVAGKTGYTVVEGPGERYGAVAPWGFIMNVYSKKKDAAWEFIKWGTGYKTQLNMVKRGYVLSTRKSILMGEEMKKLQPPEFLAALARSMEVADPSYKPLIPQQAEINDLISIGLSKVLTGQASAAKAMREVNEKALAIMKRDGYIK